MVKILRKALALDSSEPVIYELDMPPSEARRILEAAAEAQGNYMFQRRFPLKFTSERKFQLYRVRNRNSWRRILNATLENHGNGTRLSGQFNVSQFVMIFTLMWITMAFGSTAFLLATDWPESLGSLLFPIFGITLPHLGRMMTRSDERAVLELLDNAFEGRIIHRDTPTP